MAQDVYATVPTDLKRSLGFDNDKLKTSFKHMLCSAEWSSYSDVVNAGIDVTIPIYNIPIPMSANYSRDKQEAWQKQFCTATERKLDYASTAYKTAYEVDRVTADAWVKCQELQFASKGRSALSCKVIETDSSAIFEARWIRSEGEADSAAPKVISLTKQNTKCPSPTLKKNVMLGDGGAAVLCSGNLNKQPTFMLQTTRGACMASGTLAEKATELTGQIELREATVFCSDTRLLINGGTKIITNGHNLTINARRLEAEGGVQIISFLPRDIPLDTRGRSSGEIIIQSDRISGSPISITNFGEDGGAGSKGATGSQGPPGTARTFGFPQGCGAGNDGGIGYTDIVGFPGQPGMAGGNGGDVKLNIKSGLKEGLIKRAVIVTSRPDRSGATLQCTGSCLDLGGVGGAGGDNGPGGPGDPGAGGTNVCDGTNPGPTGLQGPSGPQGPAGSNGASGIIVGL